MSSSIPGLPATECWHESAEELARDGLRGSLAEDAKLSRQVDELLND